MRKDYVEKKGKSFIRIWETPRPYQQDFAANVDYQVANSKWEQSFKEYEVKDEFWDELGNLVFAHFTKQEKWTSSKALLEAKTGITLPDPISERIEIVDVNECELALSCVKGYSLLGCTQRKCPRLQFAILKPLPVATEEEQGYLWDKVCSILGLDTPIVSGLAEVKAQFMLTRKSK